MSVQKGGPDALIKASLPVSLFLCYPPPGSAMARRCLDTYKGSTVLHVGEWGGMTGKPCQAAAPVRCCHKPGYCSHGSMLDYNHKLFISFHILLKERQLLLGMSNNGALFGFGNKQYNGALFDLICRGR